MIRKHPIWRSFLAIILALTILGLQGCAEVAAFRSGVAEHGADAADQALETAIWTMCNASPVGAVKRRFKTEAEINAYNTICPDYFGVDAATGL